MTRLFGQRILREFTRHLPTLSGGSPEHAALAEDFGADARVCADRAERFDSFGWTNPLNADEVVLRLKERAWLFVANTPPPPPTDAEPEYRDPA